MKADQEGHDFTQAQTLRAVASLKPEAQKLLLPLRLKALTEIIDSKRILLN
ncbi:MAG: hypothetical protein ACAF41_02660 [Leptolyngbya sp. BL-A-14]